MSESPAILSAIKSLKSKHRAVWGGDVPFDPRALRTYRAIRWLEPAAREHGSKDPDVAFILYWIAFNAAYAKDVPGKSHEEERRKFAEYFGKLLPLDRSHAIHNSIWEEFSGPVRILLANKYLYGPFWDHANGKPGNEDWERWFKEDERRVRKALGNRRTKTILTTLFGRLYTLRNQLVHGGATWNSSLNRDTVGDGAHIMEFLVPVFIDIMLDNPDENWGPPYYRAGLQGSDLG